MRRQQKPRTPVHKLIIFTFALAAVYGGYYWGNQHQPKISNYSLIRLLPAPRTLQSLDLTDQFGDPFTDQRLIGHWNLIVFGLSQSRSESADILTLCTRILNRLAEQPELQQMTQVIFVTVDPERDKPAVLKDLMAHYSKDFLGVGGRIGQVEHLARQVGARFQRRAGENETEYRVDHSTSIALVDPQARLIGLFTGMVDAVNIASDLKQIANNYSDHDSP